MYPRDLPKTDMGWEIDPQGLGFFLNRLATEIAPGLPIYYRNGMANADTVNAGQVYVQIERPILRTIWQR